MKTARQNLGALGEEAAGQYLKKQGYKILNRNWRARYAELDIVAQKRGKIVFVEVKTLRPGSELRPEESVNYFKQKKLLRSAKIYLLKNRILPSREWQIDVIAIEAKEDGRIVNLRHTPNAIFGN